MTPEELAAGYAWCYRRLFSSGSIWRRRPRGARAAPAYLAMSYLYKRSNFLWYFLIRHNLTGLTWRPLVEWTRRRHLRFRRRLSSQPRKPTNHEPRPSSPRACDRVRRQAETELSQQRAWDNGQATTVRGFSLASTSGVTDPDAHVPRSGLLANSSFHRHGRPDGQSPLEPPHPDRRRALAEAARIASAVATRLMTVD